MEFNEKWIQKETLSKLQELVRSTSHIDGSIIEFGVWEGRSFVEIASASDGKECIAVDHWEGNNENVTLNALKERDVYQIFLDNIKDFKNISIHKMSTDDFMSSWDGKISFVHIDADHTYTSLKKEIEWIMPRLSDGGIICGDDYSKSWQGVMDAVDEMLPNRKVFNCMWFYKK
jgi:predicted O-methyltransferase YrrM